MTAPLPELLTVHEVAGYLRVDPQTVRRWCSTGTLGAVRAGRRWRIPRNALDQLLEHQAASAPLPQPGS